MFSSIVFCGFMKGKEAKQGTYCDGLNDTSSDI